MRLGIRSSLPAFALLLALAIGLLSAHAAEAILRNRNAFSVNSKFFVGQVLALNVDKDVPAAGKLDGDAGGYPNSDNTDSAPPIVALFAPLPKLTWAPTVDGIKKFFRNLNRLALSGAIDPGGFVMALPDCLRHFRVWRGGTLTLRVACRVVAEWHGKELDGCANVTQAQLIGCRNAWLHFTDIGEPLSWCVSKNDNQCDSRLS